ncbi:MAG: GGDEF domain-containing protein [Acidobacteriota bacterium]|nr:GGDEF domain-containing protein [Acidobacteriota bacterium]
MNLPRHSPLARTAIDNRTWKIAGPGGKCRCMASNYIWKGRDRLELPNIALPELTFWRKTVLQPLIIPGGILLLAAVFLLQSGFISFSPAAIDFYYYAVFISGGLLAWRFHSNRILSVLVTLVLAHRSLEFFANGNSSSGPGRVAFEAIAFLLPLNFVLISYTRERGLTLPAITPRIAVLFFQSVFVAVLCRPEQTAGPSLLHPSFVSPLHWTVIPQLALVTFVLSLAALFVRFLYNHKPVESGMLWMLCATFLGMQAQGTGKTGSAYFATAGLLMIASIIENSYVLAYHDELTGLPSRRAFNDALLRLQSPYAIAVVDIDHFKSVNDIYGHETGDQVLRLVAGRLSQVGGGGQAFRVGGEEFTILFPGKSAKDVLDPLETLRITIEASAFRLRSGEERRRNEPRRSDRRVTTRAGSFARKAQSKTLDGNLYVTVSIGVAQAASATQEVQRVIQLADKALYRAKQSGRNRIETASRSRSRAS